MRKKTRESHTKKGHEVHSLGSWQESNKKQRQRVGGCNRGDRKKENWVRRRGGSVLAQS